MLTLQDLRTWDTSFGGSPAKVQTFFEAMPKEILKTSMTGLSVFTC